MLLKSRIRWFYVWGGLGAPVAVGEGNIFHHSLREWPSSFCGRRQGVAAKPPQVTVSCLSGTTKGRSPSGGFALAHWKPSPDRSSNHRCPTSAGRGGSVSRRDHNQSAGNHANLSGGTNFAEATAPNASRSSGGSAREGLLSEKPPPSHHFAFGLNMIAARAPKKIAAAMPAEVEVRPPVKAPMKPIS